MVATSSEGGDNGERRKEEDMEAIDEDLMVKTWISMVMMSCDGGVKGSETR